MTNLEILGLVLASILGAGVALFRKFYMASTDNETVVEITSTDPKIAEVPKDTTTSTEPPSEPPTKQGITSP